jgi:hypothetical protein
MLSENNNWISWDAQRAVCLTGYVDVLRAHGAMLLT